jgi:hypothetical protein
MRKGRTWEESKPGERIESEGVEGVYRTLEAEVLNGDASTMAGRGKGVSGKGMTSEGASVGARVERVFLAMRAPGIAALRVTHARHCSARHCINLQSSGLSSRTEQKLDPAVP